MLDVFTRGRHEWKGRNFLLRSVVCVLYKGCKEKNDTPERLEMMFSDTVLVLKRTVLIFN